MKTLMHIVFINSEQKKKKNPATCHFDNISRSQFKKNETNNSFVPHIQTHRRNIEYRLVRLISSIIDSHCLSTII